jgi:GAF domain-containing protein
MEAALKPENEWERLTALHALDLLDTAPEAIYDEVTRLATELCGTPFSLVTLVDEGRQWFKSRFGLEVQETPREVAFCAHAILEPEEVFVVPDARYDQRFFDNPLTTGEPHVIFYAGVPLVDKDGHALGTLCVLDNRPRTMPEHKLLALKALARLVSVHFELRRTNQTLETSLRQAREVPGREQEGTLQQQLQPLAEPMVSEVEALLSSPLQPEQKQHLDALQKLTGYFKSILEGGREERK